MAVETKTGNEIKYIGPSGKVVKCLYIICPNCGTGRWLLKYQTTVNGFTGLCRRCNNNIHSRENHPSWAGGRVKTDNGYIKIKIYPDNPYYVMADRHGYILEHRLIMAKHLGRCLKPWEHVHHRPPGIKDDNRIEKLKLTTEIKHRNEDRELILQLQRQTKGLETRITQLEAEVTLLRGQLKEVNCGY